MERNYKAVVLSFDSLPQDRVEELVGMIQVLLKGLDIEATIIVGEEDAT